MIINPLIYRKKILIIGAGSIGMRHKRILVGFGCTVKVLSRRNGVGDFKNLTDALKQSFDLVIIANETHQHIDTLLQVSQLAPSIPIFIEKPLTNSFTELSKVNKNQNCLIGYNLRFNPIIIDIKRVLEQKNHHPYYVHFHVGQDLTTWRPTRDHQQSYSAHKSLGGGVVLDLSHEIDLALWLFGEWIDIKATVNKTSNKTIDSEDIALIIANSKSGSLISMNMNYLDLIPTRTIQISGPDYFLKTDLIRSTLEIDNCETLYPNAMETSYINMWQAILSNLHIGKICSFGEALNVQQAIKSIYANKIH